MSKVDYCVVEFYDGKKDYIEQDRFMELFLYNKIEYKDFTMDLSKEEAKRLCEKI